MLITSDGVKLWYAIPVLRNGDSTTVAAATTPVSLEVEQLPTTITGRLDSLLRVNPLGLC